MTEIDGCHVTKRFLEVCQRQYNVLHNKYRTEEEFAQAEKYIYYKKNIDISNGHRFTILKRDHYRCQICGRSAFDGMSLEVDHKIPKKHGGKDTDDNLWTLCFECNNGKRTEIL